jgi:hypothetical protein
VTYNVRTRKRKRPSFQNPRAISGALSNNIPIPLGMPVKLLRMSARPDTPPGATLPGAMKILKLTIMIVAPTVKKK